MKNWFVHKVAALVAILMLFNIIQIGCGYRVYAAENILFQSTFDNNNGLNFLQGNWSISGGDLNPIYNNENRLVLEGTNKSDYIITSNATFLSGNTGQSGYGIYFRATGEANITGYCFQYDYGVGKRFAVRKVINGKEGAIFKYISMNTVMGSGFNINAPHTIVIKAIGNKFIISVDGIEVLNYTDDDFVSGYVGLRSWAVSYNKFHDIKVVDPTPLLTSLGNDFFEISKNFISLMDKHYTQTGDYLSTWNDTRFTDLGLIPSDWSGYIEHIKYSPGGSMLTLTPEKGWEFNIMDIKAKERILTYELQWNLAYDCLTKKWYFHNLLPENEIDISTFRVESTKVPTPTPTLTPTPTATPVPTPTATPIITPEPIPTTAPVIIEFSYAYLYGYEQGTVGAEDKIKREEAVALIYRLLKQNDKLGVYTKPSDSSFSDIETNRWSFSAIEYMASINVFDKASGKVSPGVEITRGEASKIIAYSMGLQPDSDKTITFSDLTENHKYYNSVKALVDIGLLKGYSDEKIKPDGLLTRAEYVTMINRLIGRDNSYDIEGVTALYPDIDSSNWAYKDIMRASLGFSEDAEGKYIVDPSKKLKRSQIDYN